VPYPSYIDDKLQISKMLRPAGFAPVTGFYDRTGRLVYVHPGPYDTAAALERDMQRYLDLSPMA
jgi:hypothetical protein